MIADQVEAQFGPGRQLRIPQMSRPYPGLSLDVVDVTGGPQGSLLATWVDAVERRELDRLTSGHVIPSERTRIHLEVVAQYLPTGEIAAQWAIWTDEPMLEYRVLTEGKLLGFTRESVDRDNVFVFETDGTKTRSGRLNPGVTDVGILSDSAILIAYDRYFEDDQGVVLGLAMYTTTLERTDFGDGAGYLPAKLAIGENEVTFWDRSSSTIMSSKQNRPIWPDLIRRLSGRLEPEWVLHTPGTNRWGLVEQTVSGPVVVLGYVENVRWTTVGELKVLESERFAHQSSKVFCDTETLSWCAGRKWYSMSIDEMFRDLRAESEPGR